MTIETKNPLGVEFPLSPIGQRMRPSILRTMLAQKPPSGASLMAGGFPDMSLAPLETWGNLYLQLLTDKNATSRTQYKETKGSLSFRGLLAEKLTLEGIITTPENIFISGSGSQAFIDNFAKIFIEPNITTIFTDTFTYSGATSVFDTYNPKEIKPIPRKINGELDTTAFSEFLEELTQKNADKKAHAIFYTSQFLANPSGESMSTEIITEVANLALKYNVLVIDDGAYDALKNPDGNQIQLQALAPNHVVKLRTFSKEAAPSFRIAYAVVPDHIKEVLEFTLQRAYIFPDQLGQDVLEQWMIQGGYEKHIEKIRPIYAGRVRKLRRTILDRFPEGTQLACREDAPEGGLFVVAILPPNKYPSTLDMYQDAARKAGVIYVPITEDFVPGDPKLAERALRLSIGGISEKEIEEPIRRLAHYFDSQKIQ